MITRGMRYYYYYLISYTIQVGNNAGEGRCEVKRPIPIKDFKDIVELEKDMSEKSGYKTLIKNYQLIRKARR